VHELFSLPSGKQRAQESASKTAKASGISAAMPTIRLHDAKLES
jgi:hypothetical protein